MRLRQPVRLAPAAGSASASGAELAIALPSFDDLEIEAQTALRPVAVAEGSELLGVGVDPPPVPTQDLGDGRGVEDPSRPVRLRGENAPFRENVGQDLSDSPHVFEWQSTFTHVAPPSA